MAWRAPADPRRVFLLLSCAGSLTASSPVLGSGVAVDQAPPPPPPRAEDGVVLLAYERPTPDIDVGTAVFVQMSDGPVRCSVEAKVDGHGDLQWVSATSCPRSITESAEAAVRGWRFHPPVLEDKAVDAIYEVELEYVAASVRAPVVERPDWMLIRVPPIAEPRWPVDPGESRAVRRYLDETGSQEIACTVRFRIGDRDLPEDFVVHDCPGPLADQVRRMGRRWGFDVDGGQAGDGTVYTYSAIFRQGR